MLSRFVPAAALAALLPLASAPAAVTPSPGFQNHVVTAAPGGNFTGGMDALPNGHVALFDGAAVVEVDPQSGAVVQTLYTPSSFVFGSFVVADPSGTFLLFGESSNGTITKIPLDGSTPSVLTTMAFNYDAAFSPTGDLFVSGAPIQFGTTQIYRVDPATGALDLVVDAAGASGPIAFDAAGNLYYGENSASFPAPPGTQSLYRFTAQQVANALGPGHMTLADGTPWIQGLTVSSDLVIDEEGDLLLSDSSGGSVTEYDSGGGFKGVIAQEGPFNFVTTLAFVGNGAAPGAFGAFQPDEGGTLYALSTDFFSFNDLNVVTPKRPVLATTPPSPVPVGPLSLDLTGGGPGGAALLFIALTPLSPEAVVMSGQTPILIGFDPASLVTALALPLDGNGAFHIPGQNSGVGGATVVFQAVVDPGTGFAGSTNPLSVVLQ